MLSFKQKLNESKNTHMEHLEDEIINNGVNGANTAIEFLNSLVNLNILLVKLFGILQVERILILLVSIQSFGSN